MSRHFVVSVCLFFVAMSLAANPSWVSQIFVPINPGVVAGANNSQWTTTLYAYNYDDVAATIECDIEPCPVIPPSTGAEIAVPWSTVTHPGFWLKAFAVRQGFNTGVNLSVELRTVDSSNPSNAGTELPLIASTDFQTGTVVLPNVPVNGHSRFLLRIYTYVPILAHVRIIKVASGSVMFDGDVQTKDNTMNAPVPGYAEFPIDPGSSNEAMRVEVSSSEPTWAFVSVTDNVTNQFTIVAPHLPEVITVSTAKK